MQVRDRINTTDPREHSMSHPSEAAGSVSYAIIRDPEGDLLWVLDGRGIFTLPKVLLNAGATESERRFAALRAGSAALGVPVLADHHVKLPPEYRAACRDIPPGRFGFDAYRVTPHPDFAQAVAVRQPHVWLPPHRSLRRGYEPFSNSARCVVAALAERGFLPGRSQYTGVIVLSRTGNGRKQFLLRHEPDWGYGLPTKRRRRGETYAAAAERVARDELGLDPAGLALRPASETVVTDREVSRSEQALTFYCHGVFETELPPGGQLHSANPLVWVDAATVLGGQVRGQHDTDGRRAADAAVSPTAVHILQELDRVPFVDPGLVPA
jgi:hypothetical protein